MAQRSIISIGNFDGVHIGHAALIARARRHAARLKARVVALSFEPHPISRLRPDLAPARLSTWASRESWLREAGADEVVALEPTPDVLNRSPAEFVSWLVERFSPAVLVEGKDFRFGKGRTGDIGVLTELGRKLGFSVDVVAAVEGELSDQTVAAASSSLIRWMIGNGRVRDAAALLGREYEISGHIVSGDRMGRAIGYPTLNIRVEGGLLVPADGVYAGLAELPDGRRLSAAVSIGTRPTFEGVDRRVEAHLLDCPKDPGTAAIAGLAEYGWAVRLSFHAWIRDQVRVPGVPALVAQIDRDCTVIRRIMGGRATAPMPEREAAAP